MQRADITKKGCSSKCSKEKANNMRDLNKEQSKLIMALRTFVWIKPHNFFTCRVGRVPRDTLPLIRSVHAELSHTAPHRCVQVQFINHTKHKH